MQENYETKELENVLFIIYKKYNKMIEKTENEKLLNDKIVYMGVIVQTELEKKLKECVISNVLNKLKKRTS